MQPPNSPSDRLERAILLSVLYADLFDHALTFDELLHYVVETAEPISLRSAVDSLVAAGWLERPDGFVVWKGRRGLTSLRRERQERSVALWRQAREVARCMAEIPFLRMVCVCGSLAVENVPEGGDIDFFLVTDRGRLWIVQWLAMSHKRKALRRGVDVCPNYLLTLENLEIGRRDLHIAREIAHIVPLWGESTYDSFLAANRWIYEFLPNLDLDDRRRFVREETRPPRVESQERRLGGRLGETLDRMLYRFLMVYYPLRLRSRGVRKEQIRAAYQRDRQVVVGDGYAGAIRERFLKRVLEELGEDCGRFAELRLFPADGKRPDSVPLYGRQLAARYGSQG